MMGTATDPLSTADVAMAGGSELASLSDADLLDAWIRDRYPPALAALILRYSVMVLSVCRRRCRSASDAEDAFQTTFLYLARQSHTIRDPERLAGWLQRVAQRSALATLKPCRSEAIALADPPAKSDDPLQRLTQRHEAIVLDEELAALPEHYRSAIVMHRYEGRAIQDLADHFGTTAGSIRGRLQRAKQLLAQKLRRRGVVPVVALTSASVWTVTASQAAQASQLLIQATSQGTLPDPPIDPSLLKSLLSQGIRLMPSLSVAAGLLGGSALFALLMMAGGSTVELDSTPDHVNFSASPMLAQFDDAVITADDQPPSSPDAHSGNEMMGMNMSGSDMGDMGMGMSGSMGMGMEVMGMSGPDMGGMSAMGEAAVPGAVGGMPGMAPGGKLVWTQQAVLPEPTSEIAQSVIRALASPVDLSVNASLDQLPGIVREQVNVPVLLDDRGLAFAELQVDQAKIEFRDSGVPLQTALRRMLRPLGLRAIVENEGLVITADPALLVHRGIGTAKWLNVDEQAAKKIADALDATTHVEFVETPLADVIESISQQHDLVILVDRRALEEIGLDVDPTISFTHTKLKLGSVLDVILRDLDLTYTIQREVLVVTTMDAAEQQLLNRIYWLEGTGLAAGGSASLINSIQTSISPDTWDLLGGPSTITTLGSIRPAIVVSTTYPVHEEIDRLLQSLRETHFGAEPMLQSRQVPAFQTPPGMSGGMGGGMGAGMGGGGMF